MKNLEFTVGIVEHYSYEGYCASNGVYATCVANTIILDNGAEGTFTDWKSVEEFVKAQYPQLTDCKVSPRNMKSVSSKHVSNPRYGYYGSDTLCGDIVVVML